MNPKVTDINPLATDINQSAKLHSLTLLDADGILP
jgi:hypothetical protein